MPRMFIRPLTLALAVIVACAAAVLHQPSVTYACSCVQPGPPAEASAGAAAVFAGTVSSISPAGPNGGSLLVTFDLSQSWKGPEGPQLTITTADNSASCGFEFAQGEEYLVYALPQDGQLYTGLCTRTAPLAAAGEDLAALGEGNAVAGSPAPVTETQMEVPWLPIVLAGAALLVGAALFGPSLARRRR
jgi:hypothetical protein